MKTSFPFTSFQVEENFSLTVQIPPPLRMCWIFEMTPRVIVDFLKPIQTFF